MLKEPPSGGALLSISIIQGTAGIIIPVNQMYLLYESSRLKETRYRVLIDALCDEFAPEQ